MQHSKNISMQSLSSIYSSSTWMHNSHAWNPQFAGHLVYGHTPSFSQVESPSTFLQMDDPPTCSRIMGLHDSSHLFYRHLGNLLHGWPFHNTPLWTPCCEHQFHFWAFRTIPFQETWLEYLQAYRQNYNEPELLPCSVQLLSQSDSLSSSALSCHEKWVLYNCNNELIVTQKLCCFNLSR